jgi:hypothetical protein
MAVHPNMKQFLDLADPSSIRQNQKAQTASDRILAYRNREYIEKVGRIAEELLGFMLEQRQRKDWLDDEMIGAAALFCMNLRESFGSPQHTTDDSRWTPEFQKAQFAIFDTICEEVQVHFDRNKARGRDDGWHVPP